MKLSPVWGHFQAQDQIQSRHSIIIQPPLSARQQQRIADTTRERNKAQYRDDLKPGKHFDAPPFCAGREKIAEREPEAHKAGTTHEEEPKSSKERATLSDNKSEPESTNKIIAFGQAFDRKEPKNLKNQIGT
jgi:hypothetical protein